jgi:hypothetical protein
MPTSNDGGGEGAGADKGRVLGLDEAGLGEGTLPPKRFPGGGGARTDDADVLALKGLEFSRSIALGASGATGLLPKRPNVGGVIDLLPIEEGVAGVEILLPGSAIVEVVESDGIVPKRLG